MVEYCELGVCVGSYGATVLGALNARLNRWAVKLKDSVVVVATMWASSEGVPVTYGCMHDEIMEIPCAGSRVLSF